MKEWAIREAPKAVGTPNAIVPPPQPKLKPLDQRQKDPDIFPVSYDIFAWNALER